LSEARLKPLGFGQRQKHRPHRPLRPGVARFDGARDGGAVEGHNASVWQRTTKAHFLVIAAVAFHHRREAEQLLVVLLQPLKVSVYRARDLSSILDHREMPDNLAVMFSLAWKAKGGIPFSLDLFVGPGSLRRP